ncbi:MAG: DUF998 domain-containing protein [Leptotrichiaceae bacterium]|nr:DUF998 domain-containing protein [Leptotrichiaceae bacterium]
MNLKLILLSINIFCIFSYFVIMIYLHVKFKNYNPVFHAVSDYGVGKSKKLQLVSGFFSVIGSLSLMLVFMIWHKNLDYKNQAVFWLFVRAVSVIGVLIFPTDIEGRKKTKTGLLHYLFAIIQFTAVIKLTINLTPIFTSMEINSIFKTVLIFLNQTVKYSLIGVVLGLFIPPVKKVFGLIERIFLFSGTIYFLVLNMILISI